MKRLFKFILLFCISIAALTADEIHLKGEQGNIINGKILRISDTQIEYDPEGDIPFETISRNKVIKIIYDNNKTVYFDNDEKSNDSKEISEKNFSLELEIGWNGYTGMGLRTDILLFQPISLNLGAGVAGWGFRLSAGLRLYFNYPFSGAFSAGVAHNTGLKDFPYDYETQSGFVEEVIMDLEPTNVVNITYLYNIKITEILKFHFEVGYGISLKKDNYTITNNKVLSDNAKQLMSLTQPGGVILSIGLGFIF
ncbi:MAG: hypothetical protein OEZ13_09120 [Spirochaetia bacterium]|nr:hypothetical protein [Spirochaetia bacterium]